jgi:hypothetical protein
MSSTPNPTQVDPKDIPTLAPDVVLSRADFDVSKPEAAGKATPSAPKATASAPKVVASPPKLPPSASSPKVGATATTGAAVPPVDATFRAASTSNVKGGGARTFGRRLMRVVIGMILTAGLAGAAVVWESQGEVVRPFVERWAPPFVLTLLSRSGSPAVDPQPAPATVADSAATAAPSPEASQGAADNVASTAASAAPDQAQLLQSMARDLADLRQQMEQMKAGIADLKAGQDQMAREVTKTSETNLRPRISPVSPAPAQPIALPARRPPPLPRPVQPRASVSPQAAAAYVPRQTEPRAVAPPPPSAAAPPTDLSPRPPAPLREQVP